MLRVIHSVFKELYEWAEIGREIILPHAWYLAFLKHIRESKIEISDKVKPYLKDGGKKVQHFTIQGIEFLGPKPKNMHTRIASKVKRSSDLEEVSPSSETSASAGAGTPSLVFATSPISPTVMIDDGYFKYFH